MVTLLLILELGTVVGIAQQQLRIATQLPLLSDSEDPRAVQAWSGDIKRSTAQASDGEHSFAIHLGTARYSGVSLNNMPTNWQQYGQLRFALYNPGPGELALTLRLNDLQHDRSPGLYNDRFNYHFRIPAGWSHHRIPLAKVERAPKTRPMDLTQMRRLGIFSSNLDTPRTIYLDDLRLE